MGRGGHASSWGVRICGARWQRVLAGFHSAYHFGRQHRVAVLAKLEVFCIRVDIVEPQTHWKPMVTRYALTYEQCEASKHRDKVAED